MKCVFFDVSTIISCALLFQVSTGIVHKTGKEESGNLTSKLITNFHFDDKDYKLTSTVPNVPKDISTYFQNLKILNENKRFLLNSPEFVYQQIFSNFFKPKNYIKPYFSPLFYGLRGYGLYPYSAGNDLHNNLPHGAYKHVLELDNK